MKFTHQISCGTRIHIPACRAPNSHCSQFNRKREVGLKKALRIGLHDGNLESNMKQGRHKEFEHPNLFRDQDTSSKKKTEGGTKMDGE